MIRLKKILQEEIPSINTNPKDVKKAIDVISWPFKQVVNGFTKWLRRTFPNVMQLFYARNLYTDDFSKNQLAVVYNVVFRALRRTKKFKGGTEYDDYGSIDGKLVKDAWFGKGGVRTVDMILNTMASNSKFMIATTLGRFSYNIVTTPKGGTIYITDIYDFKKIPDAKTKPTALKGLTYPEKIYKIMQENNCGVYVAIRHLGYLEYPDTGLNKKPKISIQLNIPAGWVAKALGTNTNQKKS